MKDKIKKHFFDLGADVCGIANIKEFDDAPKGFNPTDIFAGCRSVIVFGRALPKSFVEVSPRIIYKHFNDLSRTDLDRLGLIASLDLEKELGCTAVPVPSDDPYDYWDSENKIGFGLLSLRHAAVAAGLGTLGKSTLLLNREYGNMIDLAAVLTDLDIPSDPPAEPICIKGCRKCIDGCPAEALGDKGIDQKPCRAHTYAKNGRGFDIKNCNKCRTQCPVALGRRLNNHA
ncbi:MAG: hypothetical protein LBV63_05350 [Candidatus Methanoplasma sp.]|jgi:epoxyqueuosine reductase QueG|nr:hypothetical protein [Candidatus Methanoplasma sp.]